MIKPTDRFQPILASVLLMFACTLEANTRPEHFEFALIGDTPYGVLPGKDYAPFDRLAEDINSRQSLLWVLHAGDIKSGKTPCSDAMYQDRLKRYNQFRLPVILTPGDNEWTDCHFVAAGEHQPLERLAKLRELFYPRPGLVTLGGGSMKVNSQASIKGFAEFPENVWWQHQQVIFAAIHVVGSGNGLEPFEKGSSTKRTAANDAEVERRIKAAIKMLDTVFAVARESRAAGAFIMIHANPLLERNLRGTANRQGYIEFLTSLEEHVETFTRPVVLAHGDTHYFRIDQPPLVKRYFHKNFTRVETYGDGRVHWIRVSVDPSSEQLFRFTQEIIEAN